MLGTVRRYITTGVKILISASGSIQLGIYERLGT